MTHQLVYQFEATTVAAFDRLMLLTNALGEYLPKGAELDGHDFGMGEFNIFVHTNTPEAVFATICELIDREQPGLEFSAGFRAFTENKYQPLWPPGASSFTVA